MTVETEIVLGPPGTGKTTALLKLVDEELSRGTDSRRIGYVSFTKRAAREAVERAQKNFGLDRQKLPYFRTLHSMCFQMLGISNSDVFEGAKVTEFGQTIGQKMTGYYDMGEGDAFGYQPADRAMFMENLARVRGVDLHEQYMSTRFRDDLAWPFVNWVARNLAKYKEAHSLMDYTDMLSEFVRHGGAPPLEVLFVDEAQDLSHLQWQVVWKLAQRCRRVVVAGDDDQAIYKWAGADVEQFIGLRGKVRVLGKSWRVPAQVQDIALPIADRISGRREKKWAARKGEGFVDWHETIDKVDIDPTGDVLVLVRNAYVAREDVLPDLDERCIVYDYQGKTNVRQSSLDAVRNWERLRRGEQVPVEDVIRVYDFLKSGEQVARGHKQLPGFDKKALVTMRDLKERGGLLTDRIWHEALTKLEPRDSRFMLRALQKGQKLTSTKVRVSTIHGSKGAEADHVVLLREMARRTYEEMDHAPEDEARVWYVGATRAKRRLSIVQSRNEKEYKL